MPVLNTALDTSVFDPNGNTFNDYQTVEKGWYPVAIVGETDVSPNKKGTGSGYFLKIAIYDPDDPQRKLNEIQDYYSLTHINGDHLSRCENKLRKIGLSVGVAKITDTSQIYNKRFYAYISIENGTNRNGEPAKYNRFADQDFYSQILSEGEYRVKFGGTTITQQSVAKPAPVDNTKPTPAAPTYPRRGQQPPVENYADETPF